MKVCIDSLQICQGHVFSKDHFVETRHEVCIEETAVEDSESKTATYELEVTQMVRINP